MTVWLNNPVDLLMPTPVHLLVLLLALTVAAFRGRVLRRWRYVFVAATSWCWLASTPALTHLSGYALEHRHPPIAMHELPRAPLIVVLASGDPDERAFPQGDRLNLASLRRTSRAVRLWKEVGGTLVFSGSGRYDHRSVAERMADLAREMQVPAGNIRVETASVNTHENVRNSLALGGNGGELVLVTSALHMPRAMAVAKRLGAKPLPAPADFRCKRDLAFRAWWPNSDALPLLGQVLHEWVGLLYYRLRGWA